MGATALAHDPTQTSQAARPRPRTRPSTLVQCLLRRSGTDLLSLSSQPGEPCSITEPTNWRAGCGKSASPVRREGRGQSLVPTPIELEGRSKIEMRPTQGLPSNCACSAVVFE